MSEDWAPLPPPQRGNFGRVARVKGGHTISVDGMLAHPVGHG